MTTNFIFALGFFDGVHLGHQALLRECVRLAEEAGAVPGAVTFDLHPQALTAGASPALLNTLTDRERLLKRYGMERILTLPFDEALRSLPWEAFLTLLVESQGASGFVCGVDFRFGHRGAGNAALLQAFCESRGLAFAALPEQKVEGLRVSSTAIRECVREGNMAGAARLLGHDHILTGPVVPGKQLGRTLGIPTANLRLPRELAEPRHGVYACRCHVEGQTYPAVTNIGTRPTVSGQGVTVEPWLQGYEGNLYGREITLEFVEFLRPEQKFTSLEDLKAAIRADAEKTKEILKTTP